jgi:predicted metal-dependent phosphoesterase TrpH
MGKADGSLTPGASPVRGRGEIVPGKADLHIHTSFSDGMAEVPELLDWVEERTDLDIIAIVDHDDVRGALAAREAWAKGRFRFEVVTGIEVTAIEGHVLALFVDEPVPSLVPLEQVVEAVRKQGGLCVVPHPLSWLTRSIGARTLTRFAGSFDGLEVACCSPAARVSLRRAAALNRGGLGLAEMGGSDAHFLEAIGSAYTEFEGSTGAELKGAIASRATRAAYGPAVAWRKIGVRRMARQTWRGIRATPRAMGWGPTARSFVRAFAGRRKKEDGRRK